MQNIVLFREPEQAAEVIMRSIAVSASIGGLSAQDIADSITSVEPRLIEVSAENVEQWLIDNITGPEDVRFITFTTDTIVMLSALVWDGNIGAHLHREATPIEIIVESEVTVVQEAEPKTSTRKPPHRRQNLVQ